MDFFTRYKKIFSIIAFTMVCLAIAFGLYYLFFRSAPAPTTSEPTATTTAGAGLPTSPLGQGQIVSNTVNQNLPSLLASGSVVSPSEKANGGVTQVTNLNDNASLGLTLSSNKRDLQYYNSDDGKFYKIDNQGNATLLSDKTFFDVQEITWAKDGSKAILNYPDGSNINYNFDTEKQITLPKHWEEFDFSPAGDKIIAKSMALDVENRWLIVANEDGSNAKGIEAIGDNGDQVYNSWSPNGQTVAMYVDGVDFNRQKVYFLGLNNENFKSMLIEGRGFQYEWSPQGDNLLYSVYTTSNGLKPELWIANAQGESIGANRQSLNINTYADKCAFSNSTTVYCAVPTDLQEGAGIFPEMGENTTDQLYEINLKTGGKKLVATPESSYTMTNLTTSSDGQYLFFTDNATNRIHRISLK